MNKQIHKIDVPFSIVPNKISILEESSVGFNVNKIRMKVILQERDVINNNNRIYSDQILRLIVEQLGPKATERKLIAELDHPLQQVDDQMEKMKRTSTLSLKNACLLFTKLEYDGKFITAECETLTTSAGKELYSIIKDNVVFGFSLRALGQTRTRPDGTIEVLLQNFKAITFDVVSNPSFSNAVVSEFLTESELPSAIHNLKQIRDEVNEVDLRNPTTLNAISKNSSPELLESSFFLPNNKVTVVSSEFGDTGIQILSESIGYEPEQTEKYRFGNTCCIGTLEESIIYLMQISSQKIVGFKL